MKNSKIYFLSFILLSFLWGSSFPIIKIGLNYAPPIIYVGIRCLFAGLIMTILARVLEGKLVIRETWLIIVICSLFNVALYQGLQGFGLFYLPSGLTAVVIYLQPIITSLMAWIWLKEIMSITKIIGLFLGFFGVVFVSIEGLFGFISPLGLFISLMAAISWAIGTVYFKYVQNKIPLLWLIGLQFFLGGIGLLTLGSIFENWADITWNIPLILTIIYTSVFTISLAWVIWLNLIRVGEASRVAAYTFLTPLVSILIGVIFLGESLNISLFIGACLIIFSIYLVNLTSDQASLVRNENIKH